LKEFFRELTAPVGLIGAIGRKELSRKLNISLGLVGNLQRSLSAFRELLMRVGFITIMETPGQWRRALFTKISSTSTLSRALEIERSVSATIGLLGKRSFGLERILEIAIGLTSVFTRRSAYTRILSTAIGYVGFLSRMLSIWRGLAFCLTFDGDDNDILLGNAPDLTFTTEDFSIELRIEIASWPPGSQGVFTKGYNKLRGYALLLWRGSSTNYRAGLYTFQSGVEQRSLSANLYALGLLNTRLHIIAVRSGSSVRIYRNGVDDTVEAGSHIDPALSNDAALVARWHNNFLECVADGIRVYSRALSPTEAAEHFVGNYKDETGLMLYLKLDEGSGTIANDSSGRGNNGTIRGASWFTRGAVWPSLSATSIMIRPITLGRILVPLTGLVASRVIERGKVFSIILGLSSSLSHYFKSLGLKTIVYDRLLRTIKFIGKEVIFRGG